MLSKVRDCWLPAVFGSLLATAACSANTEPAPAPHQAPHEEVNAPAGSEPPVVETPASQNEGGSPCERFCVSFTECPGYPQDCSTPEECWEDCMYECQNSYYPDGECDAEFEAFLACGEELAYCSLSDQHNRYSFWENGCATFTATLYECYSLVESGWF